MITHARAHQRSKSPALPSAQMPWDLYCAHPHWLPLLSRQLAMSTHPETMHLISTYVGVLFFTIVVTIREAPPTPSPQCTRPHRSHYNNPQYMRASYEKIF